MALILDKSIQELVWNETTQLEELAYTNLTYKDKYGDERDNPYLVIDEVHLNKRAKQGKVIISIFKNKAARNDERVPIHEQGFSFGADIMGIYFTKALLSANDLYKLAYDYVQAIHFPNWMTDEE